MILFDCTGGGGLEGALKASPSSKSEEPEEKRLRDAESAALDGAADADADVDADTDTTESSESTWTSFSSSSSMDESNSIDLRPPCAWPPRLLRKAAFEEAALVYDSEAAILEARVHPGACSWSSLPLPRSVAAVKRSREAGTLLALGVGTAEGGAKSGAGGRRRSFTALMSFVCFMMDLLFERIDTLLHVDLFVIFS